MNIVRSRGQPNLIYVLLTDDEATVVRKTLRKSKSALAQELRRKLKEVLK